jgi:hypothetical protein
LIFVYVYSVFLLSCADSGIATGWSPVKGVLPTAYKIKNWSATKRFTNALCSRGSNRKYVWMKRLWILNVCVTSGSPMWDFVDHRCSSCRWVKRQPRINLLYKYLLSLYRTYERTSAWRFEGCWLKKVSHLLGSLCVCLHLRVCCCYICCGLSTSYSDRVVDTLPICSFPLFAEIFPWERVLLTLKRGWIRCCGKVFILPLLCIGCLLICDWPAPELMWAVPTHILGVSTHGLTSPTIYLENHKWIETILGRWSLTVTRRPNNMNPTWYPLR